jgi:hypothetical protein
LWTACRRRAEAGGWTLEAGQRAHAEPADDTSHAADAPTAAASDDDDDDWGFETAPAEPAPQVSPLIAIIRIVAVLGMGVCIAFGLFLMLVGVRGIIIGVPIVLLAIPCYFGMQWAERLAQRQAREDG